MICYRNIFFKCRWVATSALPPLDKFYTGVALFEERSYGITAAECNALLLHIPSALVITDEDVSGKYAETLNSISIYSKTRTQPGIGIVGRNDR